MSEDIAFKLAVITTILLAPIGIFAMFVALLIPALAVESFVTWIWEMFFPTEIMKLEKKRNLERIKRIEEIERNETATS